MKLSTNKLNYKLQATSYRLFLLATCSLLFFCLLGAAPSRQSNKVYIKKLENNHYQLIVGRKPYIVKGVCYNPIPIGQDYRYDWWADPNKPWLRDGKLMQEMGVNTIRLYACGENPENVKKVIRDFYELYGIRVILGHWLGFWEYPAPLYGDKDFQSRVSKEVLENVNIYKDEPGVLMWVLGNENNYSCMGRVNPWSTEEIDKEPNPQTQVFMRAKVYYSFINDLAGKIHKIDPNHPVALGNGELSLLDVAAQFCKDVDLVACIIYRGKTFGNIFKSLRTIFDKPVLLAEFGADAYNAYTLQEDQNMQAYFLELQWQQIYQNLANTKGGEGNCLGGASFEWSDEWWKHNESDPQSCLMHDTESTWSNGSYYFDIQAKDNKNMNEEWFGIVALKEELEGGINKRIPRKAYYVIKEFWKKPALSNNKK